MADEQRADNLMAEAQKSIDSSKGFMGRMFG